MIRVKKENHRSWFMSNYYPCEFVMNGIRYKNAEAAFQSHKVPLEERRQFADMPPASAKRFGRNVAIPANWDETRDDLTPPTIEIVGFLGGSCKAHHHAACQVASYAVSHHTLRV